MEVEFGLMTANPPPPAGRELRRSDFAVLRDLSTRWADVDVYGHVNNVVHYSLFDTAVNGWLMEATGTDIRTLDALGLVVETSCQYFAELTFPSAVTAGVGLSKLGTSSVVYRLALFSGPGPGEPRREPHAGQNDANPDSGQESGSMGPVAVGRFVHVYVDRVTRRPVPVPDIIRSALAAITG